MLKQVQVQYFAVLRERRGLSSETVETDAETIGELYEELAVRHNLGLDAKWLKAALGEDFVDFDAPLPDGASVALIPPVAGG